MAKKSSTIHIENCFWDLINNFMKENGIDSRNTAIECILSEYKALKNIRLNKNEDSNTYIKNNSISQNSNSKKDNEMLNKIIDMENDMPD